MYKGKTKSDIIKCQDLLADSVINRNLNLKNLWRLDAIGIRDPAHLNGNDKALKQCNNTICYDGKHYQIAWPWMTHKTDLVENLMLLLILINQSKWKET